MNTFERKINHKGMCFRYAKGKSLVTGDEIHRYHEILYYIKGNSTFLAERFEKVLEEGTLVIIPKGAYHKFQIENNDDYTRLVFNFPDIDEFYDLICSVLSDIKIIENPGPHIIHLINRAIEILKGEEGGEEPKDLLYAILYMLLAELNMGEISGSSAVVRESDQLISKCINYIDLNFAKDISVEGISKKMCVSPSSLHLCFKRHLGISVYKYITEKRLIRAHNLIVEGANPTKVYTECGYNDYPTFYKAYVKMFNTSPCKDKP